MEALEKTLEAISIPLGSSVGAFHGGSGLIRIYHGREGWIDFFYRNIERIGTSSWADPEFVRDWYPPKLPAAARLGWYAQHFDYVEVNSTFYAIPVKKVVNRWDSETPSNFLFA